MIDKDKIKELLCSNLDVHMIKVVDDSHLHANHAEAKKSGGGHYSVFVISDDFQGKNLVARHKMIFKILQNEFKENIHALAIQAKTKEEYSNL